MGRNAMKEKEKENMSIALTEMIQHLWVYLSSIDALQGLPVSFAASLSTVSTNATL